MTLVLRSLCLGLLMLGSAQAAPSLYSTGPDEPTAYVRFVNAGGQQARLGKDAVALDGQGAATSFQPVRADRPLDGVVQLGDARINLDDRLPEGEFLTVVLASGKETAVQRFTDAVDDFNATKASITVYNAAPGCARAALSVQGRDLRIVQDVVPGQWARRQVNPVQLALELGCGAGQPRVAVPAPGLLQAGERYSVIVIENGQGEINALWLQDAMQD